MLNKLYEEIVNIMLWNVSFLFSPADALQFLPKNILCIDSEMQEKEKKIVK